MAKREASGDFEYLWADPADAGGLTSDDVAFDPQPGAELDQQSSDPGDGLWDEPDDNFWNNQPVQDDPGHFDAFNVNTWSFKPVPTAWYGTKQAVTVIVAASAAAAAIVVSGVLLVFRGQDNPVEAVTTSSVTPTAPTSAAPVQAARSQAPPPAMPPPLPPPPIETAASPVNPEPVNPEPVNPEPVNPEPVNRAPVNPAPVYHPTTAPRPTKAPEINVTRTPISVAPQPRFGKH